MKKSAYILLLILIAGCQLSSSQNVNMKTVKQTELTNINIKNYNFLDCMYQDSYFPTFLVDKCKNILLNLCSEIESKKPNSLKELYGLTHSSTNQINALQNEFFENNSEIETGARECFGANFEFISKTYGFDADTEELIATRDW